MPPRQSQVKEGGALRGGSARLSRVGESASAVSAGERGIEQSFGRAASVLDALVQSRGGGLRFTDLMRVTGFSKATLHRLLSGLATYGFVDVEHPGARYFLGFRLGAWVSAAHNRHGLAERAAPIVRRLSEAVQETAYLSVRVGEMAVCLVVQEGRAAIRALPLSPGDRSALGVGSASAAILGAMTDEAEIGEILAAPEHIAYCTRRKVSEEHIRRHIARARKQGYALVDDLNPDMTGLGVPIFDHEGRAVAALSVATIHTRMRDPANRDAILREVREAAAKLSPLFRQWTAAGRVSAG